MNNKTKNTAIQNEQQCSKKQLLVNEIINLIASKDISISDAKDVLRATSAKLGKQKVTLSSTGWINANDYKLN